MKTSHFLLLMLLCGLLINACKQKEEKKLPEVKDIVKEPEKLSVRITSNLRDVLRYASDNGGKINDSSSLSDVSPVKKIYTSNNYNTIWSNDGKWLPLSDSLYYFIKGSKKFGLFPSDYHFEVISRIGELMEKDSLAQKDAALWSRGDLYFTDALLSIAKHLKQGRLPVDSITLKKDSTINEDYYIGLFYRIINSKELTAHLEGLEPQSPEYQALRTSVGRFLDSVKFKNYTYLEYPYLDSIQFFSMLKVRLYEEKIFDTLPNELDTIGFKKAITKYQTRKKLKPTGRPNDRTVRTLNDTQWERYKRLAITLDKLKQLPDSMPQTYVWVNIPAFRLKVIDNYDSIALESRVIVGAAKTRTPELNSDISNFITYPQWTVPYSIVFKEMLPKIQKDTNFLKQQNLMVVDRNDSVIYPSKIKWAKLSEDKFPYKIRQREGDDNSLGVLKFNFRNRYAVYLHDTNARWLFSQSDRALSHGCVRVQNWKDLANFLVRNDTLKYPPDTLASWIGRQEKHTVTGFKKVPIYIRYFTCESKDGRLRFYEDIYAEDKFLAEKYFSKTIN